MADRYCTRCATEVEDVGGFCLLGHRLSEDAPTGSLSDLRAEVDRAFEDARLQVSVILQDAAPPPPPGPELAPAGPIAAPKAYGALPAIDIDPPGPGDPINDFAPAPRMDWGPDRQSLLKKRG